MQRSISAGSSAANSRSVSPVAGFTVAMAMAWDYPAAPPPYPGCGERGGSARVLSRCVGRLALVVAGQAAALGAAAPEDDLGLLDLVTVLVPRVQARSRADH